MIETLTANQNPCEHGHHISYSHRSWCRRPFTLHEYLSHVFNICCCFWCVQDYNLTDEIEQANEFTVFAPTDAAVTDYLKKMSAAALVQ